MKHKTLIRMAGLAAGLMLAGVLALAPAASAVQWRVGVSVGNAGPERWGYGGNPDVIVVDAGPVYYCGDYPGWSLFRSGPAWYGYHVGSWYCAPRYGARWTVVTRVPREVTIAWRGDWQGRWREHRHAGWRNRDWNDRGWHGRGHHGGRKFYRDYD